MRSPFCVTAPARGSCWGGDGAILGVRNLPLLHTRASRAELGSAPNPSTKTVQSILHRSVCSVKHRWAGVKTRLRPESSVSGARGRCASIRVESLNGMWHGRESQSRHWVTTSPPRGRSWSILRWWFRGCRGSMSPGTWAGGHWRTPLQAAPSIPHATEHNALIQGGLRHAQPNSINHPMVSPSVTPTAIRPIFLPLPKTQHRACSRMRLIKRSPGPQHDASRTSSSCQGIPISIQVQTC